MKRMDSPISSPAHRLKYLLERDDERERRKAIKADPERSRSVDYNVPTPSAMIPLFENQTSVENQLQQQVSFYQVALERLKNQSDQITSENAQLYERMRQSIELEQTYLTENTDEDESEEKEKEEVLDEEFMKSVATVHVNKDKNRMEPKSPKRKHKERLLRTKSECEAEVKYNDRNEEKLIKRSGSYSKTSFPRNSKNTVKDDISMKNEGSFDGYDDDDLESLTEQKELTSTLNSETKSHSPELRLLKTPTRKKTKETNILNNSKSQERFVKTTPNNRETVFTKRQEQQNKMGHEMLYEDLEKVRKLYETKTRTLQSMLDEARQHGEEQQAIIRKLKLEKRSTKSLSKKTHICSKCSQVHGDTFQGEYSAVEKKVIDRLARERDELVVGIKKQQRIAQEGNKRELEAYNQVKKSCELVEQAQLEKQQAIVQAAQYDKDLKACTQRLLETQQELQDHRHQFSKQKKEELDLVIGNLNRKVDDQSNMINVLEVQAEKSVREKVDLKKEAEQLRLHIITQKAETTNLIEEARKDVMEALKSKTLAEQEVNKCHSDAQRRDKQKQMAIDQSLVEVQELKRRLFNTEEELQKSQDEVIKLTKQLNTSTQQDKENSQDVDVKNQLHGVKHENTLLEQSYADEKKRLHYEVEQREQELTLLLQESENRYTTNRDELTRLLESQAGIVSKYQDEYKVLMKNMENEKMQNKKMLSEFQKQCKQLESKVLHASDIVKEKDRVIGTITKQITDAELETADYKEQEKGTSQDVHVKNQVVLLMNKQNTILRDRHLLTKEIELLRSSQGHGNNLLPR